MLKQKIVEVLTSVLVIFSDLNLDIEATYFDIKYDDVLEGWKTGNSSGLNYTTQNMPGTVKSKGFELTSKFKLNDHLNFGLNYIHIYL